MAKILVVDDEAEWRELCQARLSELGHEVRATGDCLDALMELKRAPPDVVVLDLRMPVSGRTMLQAITEDFPGLPVVVHTVFSGYRDDPAFAGVAGFAVKSPDLADLVGAVESLVGDLRIRKLMQRPGVNGNACR